jgi:hypothetical protein
MVSEPFSEEFGSLPPLREGHVGIGTRRPTWLVYWLLARPFFIRDRWRLKEVDHPPPVKVKEKLFSFLLILELEPPLAPTPSFRASASGGLGGCLVQAA